MRCFRSPFTARARLPFVGIFAALLLALCWLISPVQVPVVVYKLLLCVLGGLCGYLIDDAAFPYAAPDSYLEKDWRENPDADGGDLAPDFPIILEYEAAFFIAQIRRALFILIGMIALGVGI